MVTVDRNRLAIALTNRGQANELADILENVDVLSSAEADVIDAITLGTPAAGKALTLDANSEMSGLGVIRVANKLLTTGQVLALNATPITIVSAVGSNVYAEFLGAYVFLDYNSAAYATDAGEDLVIQNLSGGDEVSHSIDGTVFEATADTLAWAGPKAAEAAVTTKLVANGGFAAKIKGGEWATGNSPIKIRLYYRTIRKAALEAIA